jgi:hypothetical protein
MKRIIRNLCVAAAVVCGACQGEASLITWSASPGVSIPDNSPNAGAASDIYIAPGDSQLTGILNPSVASVASVQFTITGGWDGDYKLVLSHTDGTASQSVTLVNMLLGGAAANSGFNNVTLSPASGSDTAVASTSSTSPIAGTCYGIDFNPFQHISPTGDWLLYVTDNAAGDQGVLSGWSLSLDVVPEPVNVALWIFGGMMGILAFARSRRTRRLFGENLKC